MAEAETKTELLSRSIFKRNPIALLVLGICSALATTGQMATAFVMAVCVTLVVAFSSMAISLVRNRIPNSVRIGLQIIVIATLVILVDQILKAFFFDLSKQLSIYVGLIITNCIIMGRAEAVALTSPPKTALIDGLSSGIGYAYVLLIIAAVRELLGTGGIWGVTLLGGGWQNWTIMVMAPGGFFVLALFIWIVKGWILNPARKAQA